MLSCAIPDIASHGWMFGRVRRHSTSDGFFGIPIFAPISDDWEKWLASIHKAWNTGNADKPAK